MRYRLTLGLWLACLLVPVTHGQVQRPPCLPCAELAKLDLPDVRIDSAILRTRPVYHCLVAGVIGDEIEFETALPLEWNGRFTFSGNGGFAGSIQTSHHRIRQGYANAATNTGHRGDPLDGSWALHQAERQINFGYLAVHRSTEVAKALIRAYYGEPPQYSYFVGCSRGGGQGLMAAQRYPEDFDGIVAGAPALDWTGMAAEFVQNGQALFPDPAGPCLLDSAQLARLEAEVLAQCDTLDGLKDGILMDPRACLPDLSRLPDCPGDPCFTKAEKQAIALVYAGVTLQGQTVYEGFPPGLEAQGWPAWITGSEVLPVDAPTRQLALAQGIFRNFVFHDASWDYRGYGFEDFFEETAFTAAILDATSTDYRAFFAAGGKMLIYQGWNDPVLSALSTIAHYEAALAQQPDLPQHIRLFMMPGVLHCDGGPGPSGADWLAHLQAWVEQGEAPERIVLRKGRKGQPPLTRPTFPYPARAVYQGEGNPEEAANWLRGAQD